MDDERAILEANERFYLAFRQRDAAEMDALWAREVPIACIHPGWGPLMGRSAVMRSWREILSNPDAPKVECGAPEVTRIGDVAHVICVERVEIERDGSSGLFVATNLFAREDGAWRLVHHQASPIADEVSEEPDPPPTLLN
jgi:ketosteroid isomerase-like protein